MYAIHIFSKGLVSKIHKEFIQLKSKQKQQQQKNELYLKRPNGLNRHFFPKKTYRWQTGTGNDAFYL